MKTYCGLRERCIVVVVLTQHDDRHMSLHKPLTIGDLQKSIANVASELAASMYFSSPINKFALHYYDFIKVGTYLCTCNAVHWILMVHFCSNDLNIMQLLV